MLKKISLILLVTASLVGSTGVTSAASVSANKRSDTTKKFTKKFHGYVGSSKYYKKLYSHNKTGYQLDVRVQWSHRFGKVVPQKSIGKAIKTLKLHKATDANVTKIAKYLSVKGTPVKNWRTILKVDNGLSSKFHVKAYKHTKYGVFGNIYLYGKPVESYNPISGWVHA